MPFFASLPKVPSIDARELWMEDLEAEKSDMLQQFLGHLLFFFSTSKVKHLTFLLPFFFHTSGLSPRNLELRCR